MEEVKIYIIQVMRKKKETKKIIDNLVNYALNSKMKGLQRKAREGTENYSFSRYRIIDEKELKNMKDAKEVGVAGTKKLEGILIQGTIDGDGVVYYSKNKNNKIIKNLLDRTKKRAEKEAKYVPERPEMTPTSTYDRWYKRNKSNFESWFGKERLEK